MKCGAFSRLALGPDFAAVAVDNALNQCQAHASAFEFRVAVQALKHPEEFANERHVESDAIVLHVIGRLADTGLTTDFDDRSCLLSAEFNCVAKEIGEHLSQHGEIATRRRQRFEHQAGYANSNRRQARS